MAADDDGNKEEGWGPCSLQALVPLNPVSCRNACIPCLMRLGLGASDVGGCSSAALRVVAWPPTNDATQRAQWPLCDAVTL